MNTGLILAAVIGLYLYSQQNKTVNNTQTNKQDLNGFLDTLTPFSDITTNGNRMLKVNYNNQIYYKVIGNNYPNTWQLDSLLSPNQSSIYQ